MKRELAFILDLYRSIDVFCVHIVAVSDPYLQVDKRKSFCFFFFINVLAFSHLVASYRQPSKPLKRHENYDFFVNAFFSSCFLSERQQQQQTFYFRVFFPLFFLKIQLKHIGWYVVVSLFFETERTCKFTFGVFISFAISVHTRFKCNTIECSVFFITLRKLFVDFCVCVYVCFVIFSVLNHYLNVVGV